MNSSLFFTEEHEMLRRSVREFVERELVPHAEEWEAEGMFPDWVFRRLGELGFLGLHFPEEYGGGGGDYFTNIVLMEELAKCGSFGVNTGVAVQIGMATPPILAFGTEEQKQRYLVPAIRGEKIACLGITEPGAGSDVAAVKTYAERVPSGWKVNGNKIFITNGYRADFMTLLARTDREKKGYKGMSLFLVDTDTPGYIVSRKLEKVGQWSSDTAEIYFQDMVIPEDALLGEEGRGFYNIMWELQGERLIVAVAVIAIAEVTLQQAIEYGRERTQFGKPIVKNQAIAHRVADLATELEAAKSLTYITAWRYDRGEYPVKEISMAKLLATQVAFRVCDEAMQFMGGYGYMMEYPAQRAWRDMRVSRIGGGTDEIMREIIATSLGLYA
ncbi:acyl-CoA dehydrogenase family protein [Candidatus Solincola tengchongensis]|uniref:acyl-CoA dehydrogenase family protein n=1 Tax=Candidatus Solincola tengchongensis TaxID=2900693 RepID=UPI002580FADE|nr:acyl-CoA dehydrogenase family protein [Candidatus Solincola tengchongensis]